MAFTFVARRGVALWCVAIMGNERSSVNVRRGIFVPLFGERLRAERERLGLGQQEMADECGVTMRSQRNYEKGERQPDAAYLTAFTALGGDVLFLLAGADDRKATSRSNRQTSAGLTETVNPVTHSGSVPQIDAERLARIVELLERFAAQAGKRWPAKRLVVLAAEVYNVLADEPALDEPKVERILKLVVSR